MDRQETESEALVNRDLREGEIGILRKLENIFIRPHLTVRSGPLSILRPRTRTDNSVSEINFEKYCATYMYTVQFLHHHLDDTSSHHPLIVGTLIKATEG